MDRGRVWVSGDAQQCVSACVRSPFVDGFSEPGRPRGDVVDGVKHVQPRGPFRQERELGQAAERDGGVVGHGQRGECGVTHLSADLDGFEQSGGSFPVGQAGEVDLVFALHGAIPQGVFEEGLGGWAVLGAERWGDGGVSEQDVSLSRVLRAPATP